MTLMLDARQRAMLEHMGLRLDFLPPLAVDDALEPRETDAPALVALAAEAEAAAPPARPHTPAPTRAPVSKPPSVAKPVEPKAEPVMMGERPHVAQADWAQLQQTVSQCTACGLCKTRKQTVFGVGSAPTDGATGVKVDVMIVGEAPGEHEDLQGEPFVGAAGQLLDQMLSAVGLTRKTEGGSQGRVYIANVLKCRPPGNRNPHPEEVAQCLPYLQRQIELVRPKVLLAMGRFGAQALLAPESGHTEGTPLGKLRGQVHRYAETSVVVTYHPAYLLRSPAEKAKAWADLCLAQSLTTGA
jgi:DNA polymerase